MNTRWKLVKVGQVLHQDKESSISIESDQLYPMVGVYSFGRGLFHKESQLGMNTSYKNFYRLKENHIVMSQLFGWEGALALSSKEFEGKYVSNQFPTFLVDESKADRHFIGYFLKRRKVWESLFERGKGMGSRRRTLKPESLLGLEIPLPPLSEQRRIAERLQGLQGKIEEVRRLRGEQEREMKNLLYSQYLKVIEGAEWMPLKKVAPLNRRQVDLQPNTVYSEVGVRSFGKGVFEKPSFNSDDLTWQKPNWIKEGDLLMSNIKAWEGAVAAVRKEHNGKVGSHRYLTFEPDSGVTSADFLWYFFMTEEGNYQLNEASPGSADRNRTLNTKKILEALVPIPDLESQNEFLALRSKLDTLKTAQDVQLLELEALFPGVLEEVFRGKTQNQYK